MRTKRGSLASAKCNAFRFAREQARRHKFAVGRFKRLAGTEDSLYGPEWHAFELRDGSGMVTVGMPYEDKQMAEAVGNRSLLKQFCGYTFAVSIKPPLE